jgi:2-pyrone-4,6-dicarboxylate lactonase
MNAPLSAPPCVAPDFDPRPPREALPPLSCDCHAHILGPVAKHAYSEQRVYTPPDCLLPEYEHLLATLGAARAVLVQPSVYGEDNTVLVEALKRDPLRYRGVAVVPADVSDDELSALHRVGVRGVRINVVDIPNRQPGSLPMASLQALAEKIARLGWHIEFLLHVDEFPDLDRQLGSLPVDVVFGHVGYMPAGRGVSDAGFQALLRLLRSGKGWVKLTGAYRISKAAPEYPDIRPLVEALLDANAERLVWGSDWPHVMVKSAMPNDGDLLDAVCAWLPDRAARGLVFSKNPARLYGFA